jgi:peptide/nickel transport system ATP-binding protein
MLEISNLKIDYVTTKGEVHAVDGVSLAIAENEVFGIAGESGCGKTTLIKGLLRLLPRTAKVSADTLSFKGRELLPMSDRDFRKQILWNEISLVPQSAMNSLDPVYKVGDQVVEAIQAHTEASRAEANERVAHLFDVVGLQPSLMSSYPHEFSGGMRQRAMIAMSLALEPSLIIMDEPTTGLDVLVQERIIRNLLEIRKDIRSSILLITHDISVIAEMSDRIGIMYAGRLMEVGSAIDLFEDPYHPYTLGLKNAFPSIKAPGKELISIPGSPPNLMGKLPGCTFVSRCPFAVEACEVERPPDREVGAGHRAACHRLDDIAQIRAQANEKRTWQSSKSAA